MRIAKGRRDGIALAVALFTMVVIAALIAGVFFTATQEYRTGRNTLAQERAMTGAEFGQNMILARWDKAKAARMKTGDTLYQVNSLAGGVLDTVLVTKLNPTTFWVVSTARTGGNAQTSGRRRTGTLLTLNLPNIRVP